MNHQKFNNNSNNNYYNDCDNNHNIAIIHNDKNLLNDEHRS